MFYWGFGIFGYSRRDIPSYIACDPFLLRSTRSYILENSEFLLQSESVTG